MTVSECVRRRRQVVQMVKSQLCAGRRTERRLADADAVGEMVGMQRGNREREGSLFFAHSDDDS